MNNYNQTNNAFGQSQTIGSAHNGQPGGSLNKLPIYNSSQNYSMQQHQLNSQTPQQSTNTQKVRRKRDFS